MTEYKTTHIVFFSPTHTSEKIARGIAEGIGMGRRIETDLTTDDGTTPIEIKDALTVVAVPVYGGRVPVVAIQRLNRLKGVNAPAILTVVYGNRDYEDALIELRDTMTGLDFSPITAGAFIGEHSFSRPDLPIAEGRPDEADLQKAVLFGRKSLEKLQQSSPIKPLYVKGNHPYKPLMANEPAAPVCNENCYACGECIGVCPTHAIGFSAEKDRIVTDVKRCIKCCACVKVCPNGARIFETPFAKILHEKFNTRKEPELFF